MNSEFKVRKDAMGRFQISIGVGRIFRATTLREVEIALEHYFGGHPEKYRISSGGKYRADCILCAKGG